MVQSGCEQKLNCAHPGYNRVRKI